MFTIETTHSTLGESCIIENTQTGDSARILLNYGARLNELCLSTRETSINVIDGLRETDSPLDDTLFKNALLIPFPSRLPEGRFAWAGHEYQLPCNLPEQKIALHGFIYNQPFTLIRHSISDRHASVAYQHESPGDRVGFPFRFVVEVEDTLDSSGCFTRRIIITSRTSSPIPMLAGWHPYFTLDCLCNDLLLHVPSTDRIELNNMLLPSGRHIVCDWFKQPSLIGNRKLNDGFYFESVSEPVRVWIENPAKQLRLNCDLDCNLNQIRIVHLFTPPSRTSISIEPLTGYGYSLITGDDRIVLNPGETIQMTFRISLQPT